MSGLKTYNLTVQAGEDYRHWLETDVKTVRRINALIRDTMKTPFSGLGKPEPLRYGLSGFWSRRIDKEHRLIYRVVGDELQIISCRYHYSESK
jgi:toxin YoeB